MNSHLLKAGLKILLASGREIKAVFFLGGGEGDLNFIHYINVYGRHENVKPSLMRSISNLTAVRFIRRLGELTLIA
jgi:hypothetical protein